MTVIPHNVILCILYIEQIQEKLFIITLWITVVKYLLVFPLSYREMGYTIHLFLSEHFGYHVQKGFQIVVIVMLWLCSIFSHYNFTITTIIITIILFYCSTNGALSTILNVIYFLFNQWQKATSVLITTHTI